MTLSTIIALSWPASSPDGVYTLGLGRREPYGLFIYIWLYCIGWWFVQDAAKVFTFFLLNKYNLFGYKDTGKLELPDSTLRYIKENKEKDMLVKKGGHH